MIFEISGTVNLAQGPLHVRSPYITIAGQTAPSPGIVIRGPGLVIDTHDVVVQHVRVRVGNLTGTPIALWVRDDATRVVIDHVSISWSIWTALVVSALTPGHPPGDVTVIDSIISEALGCSGVNPAVPCDPQNHPRQGWTNSRGIGIGDGWGHAKPKVTLLRTISAHNNDRHPEIGGGTQTLLVNNLIYNPSQTPLSTFFYEDIAKMGPHLSVAIGNVLIPGPTTPGHNGYVPREYSEEGDVRLVPGRSKCQPTISNLSGRELLRETLRRHRVSGQHQCPVDACEGLQGGVGAHERPCELASAQLDESTPPLRSAVHRGRALPDGKRRCPPAQSRCSRRPDRSGIATRTGSVPNRTSEKAGPGTAADGFPISQREGAS